MDLSSISTILFYLELTIFI